jgi:hypothetical protein
VVRTGAPPRGSARRRTRRSPRRRGSGTRGLIAAAQPAAAQAPATIAYAQRTTTWEVVLTSGKVVKVPEALTVAPKDAVNAGARAPFLISADGRHIFRASP